MHPFGGTPVCPRCDKAVYAAEQAMGPGRKLYHKPCLSCTSCSKRLDSLTLLEHDQMPYCKTCHVRLFGIRDLRQANLPHKEDPSPFPFASSSVRSAHGSLVNTPTGATSPVRSTISTPLTHTHFTGASGATPLLRANSNLPTRFNRASPPSPTPGPTNSDADEEIDTETTEANEVPDHTAMALEESTSGIQRTGDFQTFPTTLLSQPEFTPGPSDPSDEFREVPTGRPASPLKPSPTGLVSTTNITPLRQTSTGTRYGMALGGAGSSPVRSWGLGGATPVCPRCGKNVYFAEQMKAVGKTWHKGCLRCSSCNTLLDSKRLNEKDGEPLCGRCYSKLHGPQGSGYALLGKAGG
ncbi:hypothetical protein EDD16DRAFT_1577162 [Pisolithus croceorrhizus]|nr:hypothetical protein EDD16DRAFT_1577162 [Pisolithus croceorrhizus]